MVMLDRNRSLFFIESSICIISREAMLFATPNLNHMGNFSSSINWQSQKEREKEVQQFEKLKIWTNSPWPLDLPITFTLKFSATGQTYCIL
jgi:hypothetical protein